VQSDSELEYITMRPVEPEPDPLDVFGYDRVRDVLAAHMWRDLQRHDKAPARPPRTGIDDGDDGQDGERDGDDGGGERDDEELAELGLDKFDEALKAMAVHRRTEGAGASDAPQETSEQRQARLANAERMMAQFLAGVGLELDDM